MKNPAAKLMIKAIRAYQIYVSPSLAPCCKYIPTCSEYAIEAIALHGAFKGFLLAVWRIMRCNPFSRGGYDPVPPVRHPRRNS